MTVLSSADPCCVVLLPLYQEDSFPLCLVSILLITLLLFRGVINSHSLHSGMFLYLQHCAGINCLAVWKPSALDGHDYLFTGSRDGRLKRWELTEEAATCSATFESHIDWVLILLMFFNDLLHSLPI